MRWRERVQWPLIGFACVMLVVLVWTYAGIPDRWPVSHPWSGLALLLGSVNLALQGTRHPKTAPSAPYLAIPALGLAIATIGLIVAGIQ